MEEKLKREVFNNNRKIMGEPLRGKIKYNPSSDKYPPDIFHGWFRGIDVKSAVEGLKDEIENGLSIGGMSKPVLKMIDKWFEDVI